MILIVSMQHHDEEREEAAREMEMDSSVYVVPPFEIDGATTVSWTCQNDGCSGGFAWSTTVNAMVQVL